MKIIGKHNKGIGETNGTGSATESSHTRAAFGRRVGISRFDGRSLPTGAGYFEPGCSWTSRPASTSVAAVRGDTVTNKPPAQPLMRGRRSASIAACPPGAEAAAIPAAPRAMVLAWVFILAGIALAAIRQRG